MTGHSVSDVLDLRHLRSWLFVPGDSERKIAKSFSAGADALIFDLEDSVEPGAKALARETTLTALVAARQELPDVGLFVRVNDLTTGHSYDDIAATILGVPDGFILPKVADANDVREFARLIEACSDVGTARPTLVPIATEMPSAIFQLDQIVRAHPDVRGIMWGMEDLATEIGARRSRCDDGSILEPFAVVRALALLAGRGAGIAVLDTPFIDIENISALLAESTEAADSGFTGKLAIHPSQVAIIDAAFTPTDTEIEDAHAILKLSAEGGGAAFRFKGKMVDTPHLKAARHLLARYYRIERDA